MIRLTFIQKNIKKVCNNIIRLLKIVIQFERTDDISTQGKL